MASVRYLMLIMKYWISKKPPINTVAFSKVKKLVRLSYTLL